MTYPTNNDAMITFELPTLIDEASDTEYYIAHSKNGRDLSKPLWQIKRIWKIGTVWKTGYPDGNQNFEFVWDDRYSYIYI